MNVYTVSTYTKKKTERSRYSIIMRVQTHGLISVINATSFTGGIYHLAFDTLNAKSYVTNYYNTYEISLNNNYYDTVHTKDKYWLYLRKINF